ncbi:hypothetical protein [Glutamicibacter sp. HZAU]|uniref:hypothetical protein n=1 Tax=Glutamicibacter sp. HZAU TaxID=2049891 RepID=UPI000FFB4283|nr:hypothetical protein [Glutamicibacter sp. HZAU]MDV2975908.1 hypothetical protein [Actinomycetes bacterium ARC8]RWZ83699.1 hypothetical protein EKH49_07780 [Glutamicibacter sp. HZAU]
MDSGNNKEIDPARILQGIEADAQQAREGMSPNQHLLFSIWGGAWIIAFLGLYFALAPQGSPLLPAAVGIGIAAAAFLIAIVISAVHSAKRGSGTKGPSMARGAIYGNTFSLGMIITALLGWRLHAEGLSSMGMVTFALSSLCLVIGVLVVAGSLLFNDRTQLIFGAWILAIALLSLAAPAPLNLLAGVLGGLGFIVLGLLHGSKPELVSGSLIRDGHAGA